MNISQVIRSTISEYNITPYEINNGRCEELVCDVIEKMGGWSEELYDDSECFFDNWEELPGHIHIVYMGKYYDSEAPDGVDHPRNLPIFMRAKN